MASRSPMSPSSNRQKIAIILIGPAGAGKSSTGNSILGEKRFKLAPGTRAGTTKIQSEYEYKGDTHVRVVDTPGITDVRDIDNLCSDVHRELNDIDESCLVVFAIVIKVGRYTEDEKKIIERLFDCKKKSKRLLINPLVIFTNRGELNDEDEPLNQTMDGWISRNPSLKAIMLKHHLKYIAFENKNLLKEENDRQVKDLLETIPDLTNIVGYDTPYCPDGCCLL